MNHEPMCHICHKDVDDPIELGEIMKKSKIRAHYYCLLLSTFLPQVGEDSGGILGFLIKDIKTEIKKSQKKICHYCNEEHASVKCHLCEIFFHPFCGLSNDCLFQFVNEFISFCHKHHNISHAIRHEPSVGCYICLAPMGKYNPLTSIAPMCCKLDCWVHRYCMKKYALSAGYYLHCLWCKSKEFRDDIRRLGVFVPDRDAVWERERGAFGELYQRYSKCDAEICFCAKGRDFKGQTKWDIIVCNTCATSGIHVGCLSKDENQNFYQCAWCREILKGNKTLMENSIIERNRNEIFEKSRPGSPDRSLYISKSQKPVSDLDFIFTMPALSKSQKEVRNIGGNNRASFLIKHFTPSPRTSKNSLARSQSSSCSRDSSKHKVFLSLDPCNRTKIEYVLLDAFDNIVKREEVGKPEFDDDLIHKLAEQLKKEQKLHEEVIDVSEDDDSDKSAGELFEKVIKTSKGNVPKPQLLNISPRKKRELSTMTITGSLNDSQTESCNNSSFYRVSACDEDGLFEHERLSTNEVNNAFTLEDKIKRYFKDYRLGSPDSV